MTTEAPQQALVLPALAAEINTLHDAANQAAATAIHYAARCGAKLNEAKAQCRHGEWLPQSSRCW